MVLSVVKVSSHLHHHHLDLFWRPRLWISNCFGLATLQLSGKHAPYSESTAALHTPPYRAGMRSSATASATGISVGNVSHGSPQLGLSPCKVDCACQQLFLRLCVSRSNTLLRPSPNGMLLRLFLDVNKASLLNITSHSIDHVETTVHFVKTCF